ncbi:PBECR3 domain-containing polyvalent protein [Flavobacterium sp. WC2509]|uniref:PBECR3 domain-containing polyvalent protein n=1 Tax=Flavobacterium sp. WC2509 TaxID=3461406 RepID=UPI004044E805
MKEQIKRLVEFAKNSKNATNSKLQINIIDEIEAEFLELKTGFKLLGYKRIIDKFSINHTLKNHGNIKTEALRGQIAITDEDFELIPKIIISKNIIHTSKNNMGNDLILYEAIIENTFYYVEEVRKGKKELCMTTMYKRKPTT